MTVRTVPGHRWRCVVPSAAALALAACGCGDRVGSEPPRTAPVGDEAAAPAQVVLASTDLAVGRERFAFAILTPEGSPIERADASVAFYDLDRDDPTVAVATADARFYAARMAAGGLYVVRFDLATAGAWGAEITATLADGRLILPQRVRFEVAAAPRGVGIGDVPPPTANRSLATEPNLSKLTSDPQPDADFYRLSVDEAAASGRPTVIVFATPGYCVSRICGPVLDEVKAVKAEAGRAVNFVHIDVYRRFDPLELADEMGAWGLTTEPWVYVLDAEGRVADRLEGSVTAAELLPIVQGVAGRATR